MSATKTLLQVPTNNAPVTQNEENLLSLENELESIEKVGNELGSIVYEKIR